MSTDGFAAAAEETEMADTPVAADCEHHFASHIKGGAPLHVRICQLCHEPDWGDLAEQAANLRDRIAELEAENERLRADLDAATHFLIGGYWVARKRYRSDWQVWPNPALVAVTEIPEPETYASRDAAIARARQIAVEGE